jgi:hypothetical protein
MARHKQPKPIHQLTSAQFDKLFPDEDACRVYLVARRWPEGSVARVAEAATSMNSKPWLSMGMHGLRRGRLL